MEEGGEGIVKGWRRGRNFIERKEKDFMGRRGREKTREYMRWMGGWIRII